MPTLSFFLQVVLPLCLIASLVVFPMPSALGLLIHGLAVGAFLLATTLVMIWSFLPWWVPYLYGLLGFATFGLSLARLIQGGIAVVWPRGPSQWTMIGTTLIVATGCVWAAGIALAGRTPPAGAITDLASPFPAGVYLVAHGGSRPLINGHMKTLDPSVPRFRDWRGQSYAIDFFRLGPMGLHGPIGGSTDPGAYTTFGTQVLAPCRDRVVAAEAERPDMQVSEMDREHKLGNHVILNCEGLRVVLAHLRQNSLRVESGDQVLVGDALGEAGNSGNSSEPHLHLHVQRSADPGPVISGDPVPFPIQGHYLVRNDRLKVPDE